MFKKHFPLELDRVHPCRIYGVEGLPTVDPPKFFPLEGNKAALEERGGCAVCEMLPSDSVLESSGAQEPIRPEF